MIKVLKLPVEFSTSSEKDMELAETCGIPYEPKLTKGFFYVNPTHIGCMNPDDVGNTTLGVDGDRWNILIKFDEFIKQFEVIELK